jgi:MFS family permease
VNNSSKIISRPLRGIARTFASLKHYNFRVWFIGQLTSLVGTWMQSTAQGYLVYTLTGSAALLGVVGFASGLPMWFFSLYGGVIADRIPRRNLLVITQAAMMILAFILAGLVFLNLIQPWHIIVLAFLLGIANAFDAPARHSFVVDLVDREDLTNAIALNATMFNTATVVGPAVAGITYAAVGPAWCFMLNGFSFIAVIISLLFMRMKPVTRRELPKTNALTQIKDGFVYVSKDRVISQLIASLGVLSVFGFSLVYLLPLWAVDILGGDVKTNGLLLSARGLGSLMGALTIAVWGHRRIKGKIWTVGSLLSPVALVVFAFTRWLPLSLLMLAALGWGIMSMANTTNALVQSHISDEMRGRVMGIYSLIFMGSMPLGSLLIGTLAEIITPTATVLICAAAMFLYTVFILFRHPEIRKLE